ncbi:FadR/GntR family transcriptional regulator [Saccharopolyspora sp. 5N102]|uniref:FadR/GntR family transcriptional regulator n=1 Tax=Saccharopolyspora sp. 5N102 TaxID=3375155 RepID=UPI00378A70B8
MGERVPHRARSAMFAPLDQTGRVEAVTRRLVDAITLGLLVDEEQLPSEAELAGQLGVSTVTIREALMALRQQGLVETRRGRSGGSFVRAPRDHGGEFWRERLREVSLGELRDLGDHYAAIAGAAARLAAERSSPEDLERLEQAADDVRGTSGNGTARAERQFHLEVAAAAQSSRLTQQEVQLQGELGAVLWLSAGCGGGADRSHSEHRAIAEAIARADGPLARTLTEKHILAAVDRAAEVHLELTRQ